MVETVPPCRVTQFRQKNNGLHPLVLVTVRPLLSIGVNFPCPLYSMYCRVSRPCLVYNTRWAAAYTGQAHRVDGRGWNNCFRTLCMCIRRNQTWCNTVVTKRCFFLFCFCFCIAPGLTALKRDYTSLIKILIKNLLNKCGGNSNCNAGVCIHSKWAAELKKAWVCMQNWGQQQQLRCWHLYAWVRSICACSMQCTATARCWRRWQQLTWNWFILRFSPSNLIMWRQNAPQEFYHPSTMPGRCFTTWAYRLWRIGTRFDFPYWIKSWYSVYRPVYTKSGYYVHTI